MSIIRSKTFRAIAEVVVPETSGLDAAGWVAFERIIENALAKRPAAMRRQLAAFLRLLNVASLVRYLRPLHTLNAAQRTALLSRFQDSPLLLLRRGFWGVRTLVFMGYYARPEAAAQIGYAANARGWEVRR